MEWSPLRWRLKWLIGWSKTRNLSWVFNNSTSISYNDIWSPSMAKMPALRGIMKSWSNWKKWERFWYVKVCNFKGQFFSPLCYPRTQLKSSKKIGTQNIGWKETTVFCSNRTVILFPPCTKPSCEWSLSPKFKFSLPNYDTLAISENNELPQFIPCNMECKKKNVTLYFWFISPMYKTGCFQNEFNVVLERVRDLFRSAL